MISTIVLAMNWKKSNVSTVKQFDSAYKCGQHIKGKEGSESQPDSYRSIAKFLSKNGKVASFLLSC